MDLRYSERINTTLKINIYQRGYRLLRCGTKNISPKGMFLKTGTVFFPRNTPLEIRFSIHNNEIEEIIFVRAYVIHISQDGMGIKFFDDQGENLIHFQQTIREAFCVSKSI